MPPTSPPLPFHVCDDGDAGGTGTGSIIGSKGFCVNAIELCLEEHNGSIKPIQVSGTFEGYKVWDDDGEVSCGDSVWYKFYGTGQSVKIESMTPDTVQIVIMTTGETDDCTKLTDPFDGRRYRKVNERYAYQCQSKSSSCHESFHTKKNTWYYLFVTAKTECHSHSGNYYIDCVDFEKNSESRRDYSLSIGPPDVLLAPSNDKCHNAIQLLPPQGASYTSGAVYRGTLTGATCDSAGEMWQYDHGGLNPAGVWYFVSPDSVAEDGAMLLKIEGHNIFYTILITPNRIGLCDAFDYFDPIAYDYTSEMEGDMDDELVAYPYILVQNPYWVRVGNHHDIMIYIYSDYKHSHQNTYYGVPDELRNDYTNTSLPPASNFTITTFNSNELSGQTKCSYEDALWCFA